MEHLKSLGIIAEYNPFHNGHLYQLNTAKKETGADCVIAIMSGNFVQRGEPAFMDKYTRAEIALNNGADLVIELPVISACSSSWYFSKGAVSILNKLSIDYFSFGSESGDLETLCNTANILINNEENTDRVIKELVATGISYPLARQKALSELCSFNSDLITNPNNILAIEYLMECQKTKSSIIPHTTKRLGNNYNDTTLSETYSSATSIRNTLLSSKEFPDNALNINKSNLVIDYASTHSFINIDDFTVILFSKLNDIKYSAKNPHIADLPEYLLNKLINNFEECSSVTQLIETVKSKDLTYTRISRALMHIILSLTNKDYDNFVSEPCKYIRVLGLNDTGAAFLSTRKKNCTVPIITKPSKYKDILKQDIFASDIYNLVLNLKSQEKIPNDLTHKIIKL